MFMPDRRKSLVVALWLAFVVGVWAEDSSVLNYQGRVSVLGKPYSGRGHFCFAILDGAGEMAWASGPFPLQRTTNLPPGVVSLTVSNGLYAVRLGDTAAGMPALDVPTLATTFAPKLRIWFNDGTNGWQQAGNDVSLASVLRGEGNAQGAMLAGSSADAILREVRQVRLMLERQRVGLTMAQLPPRPPDPGVVTVAIGDEPALGMTDAPLVLVEFTDFECPYCKRFQDEVMPELMKTYVGTGKLRIVSRNLPLGIHTNAETAALAALCAHEQKRFWQMRDMLFTNSHSLSASNLISRAGALQLDVEAFRICLDKQVPAAQLKKDGADARAAGITGTPSFVLGKPAAGSVTGMLIVGVRPFAVFDAELKKLLGATQ
jgi:protein-disulfide isomerase